MFYVSESISAYVYKTITSLGLAQAETCGKVIINEK
jgi:hypothetical protein